MYQDKTLYVATVEKTLPLLHRSRPSMRRRVRKRTEPLSRVSCSKKQQRNGNRDPLPKRGAGHVPSGLFRLWARNPSALSTQRGPAGVLSGLFFTEA